MATPFTNEPEDYIQAGCANSAIFYLIQQLILYVIVIRQPLYREPAGYHRDNKLAHSTSFLK